MNRPLQTFSREVDDLRSWVFSTCIYLKPTSYFITQSVVLPERSVTLTHPSPSLPPFSILKDETPFPSKDPPWGRGNPLWNTVQGPPDPPSLLSSFTYVGTTVRWLLLRRDERVKCRRLWLRSRTLFINVFHRRTVGIRLKTPVASLPPSHDRLFQYLYLTL